MKISNFDIMMHRNFLYNRLKHIRRRFLSTLPADKSSLQAAIGLEVHAQIASDSKLFSGATTNYSSPPNTAVSLFDCSTPGTLPRLNARCLHAAVSACLLLNCTLAKISTFDRKHYFYADMPLGYQITQHRQPIGTNGSLEYFLLGDKTNLVKTEQKLAPIDRVQLEMDSGKTIHDPVRGQSLIDLNRAGVGLLEIVTGPHFTSGLEAACFVDELRWVLREIGVCHGAMEKGQLRVDANVSVHRPGDILGTRTELKNLNSIRLINAAVQYEIGRQISELVSGRPIVKETRAVDVNGVTVSMRDKEVRDDYRFLSEPNLPPIRLSADWSNSVSQSPPVSQKRRHFIDNLRMDPRRAVTLTRNADFLQFFTDCMKSDKFPSDLNDFFLWSDELEKLFNIFSKTFGKTNPVTPENLLEVIDLVQRRKVTKSTAFNVLKSYFASTDDNINRSPSQIIDANSLWRISDYNELDEMSRVIFQSNSFAFERALCGQEKHVKRLGRELFETANKRIDKQEAIDFVRAKLRDLQKGQQS